MRLYETLSHNIEEKQKERKKKIITSGLLIRVTILIIDRLLCTLQSTYYTRCRAPTTHVVERLLCTLQSVYYARCRVPTEHEPLHRHHPYPSQP